MPKTSKAKTAKSTKPTRTAKSSSLAEELIRIRRDIHAHPELGYKETRTAQQIETHLRGLGLRPRRMAGTGVVAEIESGKPGKCLMLRADIDALPMQEHTGFPYASKNDGVMHACGHDLHVAILVGVAGLLQAQPPLNGRVRLCFQPAEEGLNGAGAMLDAGVLDGVDAALGYHVWQSLPVGRVAAVDGPALAAVDEIHITVRGEGAHAATPHRGVDPIVVAAHLVTALQTLVSRNTDPMETAVVTIGKIEGGTAFNIIPESVQLVGTVRTFSKAVQGRIRTRMQELVKQVCAAFGATGTLEYKHSNPATLNDPVMAGFMRDQVRDVLGASVLTDAPPTMGGEDFAVFSERVPACYAFLGCAPKSGPVHQHHHPGFNPDEGVLEIGAQLMSQAARRWLEKPTGRNAR